MDQMKRLVQDEFNRLATDFYDFKKTTFDAGIIPLRGVSNIAVTKDQYGMSATWELPDGDEITPTHVRVRILEISPNSWSLYTYPKTSWEFNGLTPGTQYTLQIQLVATFEATDTFVSTTRNCPSVPVLRTAESDIKAKVFTTDDGVGPPTDGITNDTTINFNFPNTQGTPGTVGGGDCWWEYKIQYRAACAWVDTGAGGAEVDGNVGDVTMDTASAPFSTYPNALFRLAYREICNSVPQAWVYAEPFMAVDFADADCLGIVKSASLSETPFDTADLFAIPGVCQADGTWMQIVDVLTDTELFPQEPGFKCVEYIDDEWTLIADSTDDYAVSNVIYTGLLAGQLAAIGNLNAESDFTLYFEINVADNALALRGGTGAYTIIELGGKIKVQLIENTSEYSLQITVPRDGGGAYVFRADDLVYGDWVSFYYVHDVSEPDGRILYVNTLEVARSSNAIANDFDGITSDVTISTVNDMQIRAIYGWAQALSILPDVPGIAGYVLGGNNTGGAGQTTIYKLTFSTEVRTTLSATLTGAGVTQAGFENGSVAGYAPRGAAVERLDFTAETNSVLAATLTDGRSQNAAASDSGVGGYVAGGAISGIGTDRIDKIAFPAETKSTLSAVLGAAVLQQATIQDQGVAGYFAGNINTAGTEHYKLAFPAETRSTLSALVRGIRIGMGVSLSGTAGYYAGGRDPNTTTDEVLKVAFPSDTDSNLGSTLSATRDVAAAMEDSFSGGGGYLAGGLIATTTVASIEKFTFATETASTLSATLAAARGAPAGVSNSGL